MAYNIEETQDIPYAAWLDSIPGFGRSRCYQLVETAGSARNAYEMPDSDIAFLLGAKALAVWQQHRKLKEPNALYETYLHQGISYVYYKSKEYPQKLRNIPDPPFGIYYKGSLPDSAYPAVAMIGARRYSDYGRSMAELFARRFGQAGITVISGMAMGIDGISQRAAINAGGISYGVLGCGADVIYPESNSKLYYDLIEKGGILSEYQPATPPRAGLFPQRNRIISALADVVLVVEARHKSGTLITVDMALEQGKEVYVIPGRCTDQLSLGCNQLLRQGALAATSPEDIMKDMGWQQEVLTTEPVKRRQISELAQHILAVLDVLPCTSEDIVSALAGRQYGYSVTQIYKGITELELAGLAKRSSGLLRKTEL